MEEGEHPAHDGLRPDAPCEGCVTVRVSGQLSLTGEETICAQAIVLLEQP